MRLGIIISIVIVALLAGLFYVLSGSAPDAPTKATSPEKLKEFKLKSDLPAMWDSPNADEAAGPIYDKLLTLVSTNKRYQDENVPDTLVETMLGILISASEAKQLAPGFMDDKIPLKPSADPTFGPALEYINDLAIRHASKLKDRGEPARAVRILRAHWALGQRCFQLSHRLYPRRIGLSIMTSTADMLNELSEQDSAIPGQLSQWTPELQKLQAVWTPKIELILNIRPQIGDLLNLAAHEEDVAFRTEAVLQLGLKKFAPGGRKGNKDAIEDLIKRLQSDEEPQIAKAAKAAADIQKEDIGKIR